MFVGFGSAESDVKDTPACGPRAVCVAARLLGREISDGEIREAFEGRVSGLHSGGEIAQAAERLGMAARQVRLDAKSPHLARVPLIVAVKDSAASSQPDHFLVLYGEKDASAQVIDFPHAPRLLPVSTLARVWDGHGLYVARDASGLPSSPYRPLRTTILTASAVLVAVISLVVGFRCRTHPAHARRTNSESGRPSPETGRP